ncbi:MAG: DUF4296 domain-containing protein [Bacteroidota bacterium]
MVGCKKILCYLLLLICLFGCRRERPGKEGILSVNDMKKVMWDMVQADEFAGSFVKKDSVLDLTKETNLLYQKVFALHKIDSARFFKSFYYYKQNPGHYKVLMDSLFALSNRERENRFYINKGVQTMKPQ